MEFILEKYLQEGKRNINDKTMSGMNDIENGK